MHPLILLRSRERASDDWTEVPVAGVTVHGPDNEVSLNRSYVTKALRFGGHDLEETIWIEGYISDSLVCKVFKMLR